MCVRVKGRSLERLSVDDFRPLYRLSFIFVSPQKRVPVLRVLNETFPGKRRV